MYTMWPDLVLEKHTEYIPMHVPATIKVVGLTPIFKYWLLASIRYSPIW